MSHLTRRLIRVIVVLGFAAVRFATGSSAQLTPPANDDCAGAVVIPDGPYPVVMGAIGISNATPQGTTDPLVCPEIGVDQDVWWSFTPSEPGSYVFSTCAGGGAAPAAAGTTVYDTVLGVFDGCPGAGAATLICNDTAAGCVATDPFAPYVDQSTGTATLLAGHTYFIAAGHWSGDTGGVIPQFSQIALSVARPDAPPNDTCSAPTPLALDRITPGTTVNATNDYRSPTGCFGGYGQIPSSANGSDVVFSFTPPDNDTYSFRYVQDDSSAALRTQSPVLYLADNCPAPSSAAEITGCIAAANRMDDQTTGNGNRSEEISCVPLTGGTPYYLFFDDRSTGNAGGPLAVEVTRCRKETEPNDGIATATPFAPNSGCFMEGTSAPSGPAGDVDFYDLGAPPAGSKIFAAIDSAASNQSDYTMRITTATDTIGYDDNDGTSWVGSNAPIVAGPIAPGGELYARVNGVPTVSGNEPYSLFARIETGPAQSEAPDDHSTDGSFTFLSGTTKIAAGGGLVKGTMSLVNDMDCFEFVAHVGDNILAFSDNNPNRIAGTVTNVWPTLVTLESLPPSQAAFTGQVVRNLVTPSPGTLTGVTPSVVSEFVHYRARYDGAYMICYLPTLDAGNATNPPASAYPLPYQGSISLNCGPIPGPSSADVSLTKTGPPGPVMTGQIIDYTITLTNHDATGVAQDVRLVDQLSPEVTFAGLTVVDGFAGRDTGCTNLPTLGTNDGPIDCTNFSIAPGASVTYTLSVQVGNCIGAGKTIANSASIRSYTPDADPSNDTASWTFTTAEDGTCQNLLCGDEHCFHNYCVINDHCEQGVCVSDPRDCDDNNVCTDDYCDPTRASGPCINDSSQLGDCCGDGNDCTADACDPVLFCVFPPKPAGTACSDFRSCTTNDACDGLGDCVGQSPCDDGLPCTDDFTDDLHDCSCFHAISFSGTLCDDANACTSDTYCDGLGGTAADCIGGTSIGPGTVNNVHVDKSGGAAQVSWSQTASATSYDVVRGVISSLPVGPGGGDENCVGPNVTGTTISDPANPSPGQGFFYLIRGKAACGAGPYGTQGVHGSPSIARSTTTCGS